MKKPHPPIVEHFMSYLTPHGAITARAMFGGFGIYLDGVIFAIIVEKELYFKVDEKSQKQFESLDSKQFVYEGQGRPVGMSYFTLPEKILKSPEELTKWIKRSHSISLKGRKRDKAVTGSPVQNIHLAQVLKED